MWGYIFHAVTAGVAAFGPNFHHFTWVSLAAVGVYAALGCIGVEHHYFWTIVTIEVIVILGVTLMSQLKCAVFEEAYAENGALMFITGNFVMHYLPLLIVLGLTKRPKTLVNNTAQVWTALALFMGWYYYDKPMQVYGCRLAEAIDISGVVLTCACVQVFVIYLS